MKVIITYGTFDLFHVGHVRLLKRLKKLGDKLIVGISSDEFNRMKGKESFYSYEERAEIVSNSRFVDVVFAEHNWNQKREDIEKYQADVFAMGNDWEGKFDDLNNICNVVYLPRTKDISSTEIKKKLSRIKIEELEKIESSLHDVIDIIRSIS